MAASPLPAVVAFTRVAHHASFSRAADELGVSPSALSQTVRGLEQQLGVRLLHRTTRRVGLTEHGARFLEQVRVGLDQIDAAFQTLDAVRDTPAGLLRITLPRLVAERLVMPRLPAFHARYPQVQVELFVDRYMVDLVAEGFDAGVRLGESLARDMVALPIGPMHRQVVVGTPDYFARHGVPATPADLVHHACILHRLTSGRLMPWEFTRDGRDFEVEVHGPLISNDSEVAYLAACSGLGLVQCFSELAQADLAEGRLVSVLQDWQLPFAGFHIYYPAREHLPPKLRVFVDFMREGL
ncbi:DNA-binding transcriptional regulator, LysR family [Pseudoxanthomonas sp. GM95]|uniref:LysR family transcriptional regulator n=1 Tax=Pseudoxanthomonas sp. GM95 TaxID=1881043 RepID=UPI0008D134EF|nr:LysR family transcriptional regulator [Pseudoxanthomonas sp. GM95]SEM26397.1 DNA-binding transcriptional regulator, LysR family [Pseudoxanthomonas sp. GM95]